MATHIINRTVITERVSVTCLYIENQKTCYIAGRTRSVVRIYIGVAKKQALLEHEQVHEAAISLAFEIYKNLASFHDIFEELYQANFLYNQKTACRDSNKFSVGHSSCKKV